MASSLCMALIMSTLIFLLNSQRETIYFFTTRQTGAHWGSLLYIHSTLLVSMVDSLFSSLFWSVVCPCVRQRAALTVMGWRGNPTDDTDGFFICFCFTSQQHQRSNQDRYRLMTECTHGDFIVLPHWKTRPSAPWPDSPLSHIILTLSPCPILIMPCTELGSDMYKFYK